MDLTVTYIGKQFYVGILSGVQYLMLGLVIFRTVPRGYRVPHFCFYAKLTRRGFTFAAKRLKSGHVLKTHIFKNIKAIV